MALKARNADYIREYNRKAVLRLLRRNPMSRAQLARDTGLTRAATSLIADELLSEGVLMELSPKSSGRGRCAIPLAVSPDRYLALGVFLSRTGCCAGLCDFSGNLLCRRPLELTDDPVEDIVRTLEELLETVDRSKVVGIGISSPGPLDTKAGRILNPPRFDRWHGMDIGPILSERMGMPAYLEHDACALALHQLEQGSSRDFLFLLVNSGVGSGIVSNGRLLGGTGHFTGELGHTTIRFDGRRCECGNRGCLEAYAAIPNLLEGSRFASWKELIDEADSEDARILLDREGEYLAAGVINLMNLIPLDTVYLAGDVGYGSDLLGERLKREIATRALSRDRGAVEVLPADLRPEAVILSAGDIVFSRFLTV
ncbi:MAG: ROK family protein [Oscillospiraceae bacterium]|nr:ROK family protein [Oscillospiraceae bacterium]